MALRRRGKNNFYHAYFRKTVTDPDGRLREVSTTVNLGTDDLLTARALEADLMRRNRAARLHQRAQAHLLRLEIAAGERPGSELPKPPVHEHRKKRLRIANALETAARYRSISRDGQKIFRRFAVWGQEHGFRYLDEIAPDIALAYLTEKYGAPEKGKSFNNNKTALNALFHLLLVDAGMEASPFAPIPDRRHVGKHQRPFTEEEFKRIWRVAPEPWKTASLIAWHTGMREETVFKLRWSYIEGDVLTTMPGKTARFGRSVRIPLHPQVMERLKTLPHVNDRVLGCFPYHPKSSAFHRAFGEILRDAGIASDERGLVNFNCFRDAGIASDERGLVNFNCFRDSFITRCDEHGIPRHATRGIVGHRKDDMTDLYSHDLVTARRTQSLPWVELEE